ncbi:MAG TPA: hypothetical protein P5081_19545 [Phycisphaerae bacterium]|nr:hypothetical protein [Phycisphaerae bacterium]HRW55071.1 hypothetical protein [Phycisphaerae bacterium]
MISIRTFLLAPLLCVFSGAMCAPGLVTRPSPELLPPDIPVQPMRSIVLDDAEALKDFRVSRRTCTDELDGFVDPTADCGHRSTWIFDENVNLAIFFDAGDLSVERVTARIAFPEYLVVPDSRSAWSSELGTPAPTAVIEELSDHRIRGYVTGIVWNVVIRVHRRDDPNCVSDDILGECAEYVTTNTPYRIEFDLAFDALECLGPGCS